MRPLLCLFASGAFALALSSGCAPVAKPAPASVATAPDDPAPSAEPQRSELDESSREAEARRVLEERVENAVSWAFSTQLPEVDVRGDSAFFVGADGQLYDVDARFGRARWRAAPPEGFRWRAFAASTTGVLLLATTPPGPDRYVFLDRRDGAPLARGEAPDSEYRWALPGRAHDGEALYLDHGCAVSLLDGRGRVITRRSGLERTLPVPGADGRPVHRCERTPDVLARGDGWTALYTPEPGGGRLELVDDAGALTGRARSLDAGSEVVLETSTRQLIVTRPGRVEAYSLPELTRRWSRALAADRALVGEGLVEFSPTQEAGAIAWLDARTGETIRRSAVARHQTGWMLPEGLLVRAWFGLGRVDEAREVQWFAPKARSVEGRVESWIALRAWHGGLALVDFARGRTLLDAPWTAALHGVSPPGVDGRRVAVLSTRARSVVLGIAFDPARGAGLLVDPLAASPSECAETEAETREEIMRWMACHPHGLPPIRFAPGSVELDAESRRRIEALAKRWRRDAIEGGPAELFVFGDGGVASSVDPWGRPYTRADAVRQALIDAGVACTRVHASDTPRGGRRTLGGGVGGRVELVEVCAACCLL